MAYIPQPNQEHAPPEMLEPAADLWPWQDKPSSAMFKVDIAARSYAGSAAREDHYLVLRAKRSLQTDLTNLPEAMLPHRFDEVAYGMLIAAGMDGMPAGELASGMAVCKLIELVVNTPDWNMKINRRRAAIVMRRMRERFHGVDQALKQRGERD